MNVPSDPQMLPSAEAVGGTSPVTGTADPLLLPSKQSLENAAHVPGAPATPAQVSVNEALEPSEIVPHWIRAHVRIIHSLATPLTGQAVVIAAGFGEDPGRTDPKTGKPGLSLKPKVIHADVGEIDETLNGITRFVKQPHYNVYMPLAVFRIGLPPGAKGFEKDIIACLGIVADFDDPDAARWAERLPVSPNYVLARIIHEGLAAPQ